MEPKLGRATAFPQAVLQWCVVDWLCLTSHSVDVTVESLTCHHDVPFAFYSVQSTLCAHPQWHRLKITAGSISDTTANLPNKVAITKFGRPEELIDNCLWMVWNWVTCVIQQSIEQISVFMNHTCVLQPCVDRRIRCVWLQIITRRVYNSYSLPGNI